MARFGLTVSATFGLAALASVVGCSGGATETGYEPRRLGLSDGQRRALYAPKYSPEQAQAQSERDQEARRKPGAALGTPY
jgi:hypothetical protein